MNLAFQAVVGGFAVFLLTVESRTLNGHWCVRAQRRLGFQSPERGTWTRGSLGDPRAS